MTHNECIHEEQIQGISRKTAELETKAIYKEDAIKELKEANKRMEDKIDELLDGFNDFKIQSAQDDTKLDLRLTKIETRMEEQEKALEQAEQKRKEYEDNNNKAQQKTYQKLALIFSLGMLILAALTYGSRFIQ